MTKYIFIGAADKTDMLLHCAELLSLLADVNILLIDATMNEHYRNIFEFERGVIFDYCNKFDIATTYALRGIDFNQYDVCLIDTGLEAGLFHELRLFDKADELNGYSETNSVGDIKPDDPKCTRVYCATSFKKNELLPLKQLIGNMKTHGYENFNCIFYDIPYTGIETDYVLSELFGETETNIAIHELYQNDNDRDLNVAEQHNERMDFKKHSKNYRTGLLDICVSICNLNTSYFDKLVKKNGRTLRRALS